MKTDLHIHSTYSSDSHCSPEEIAATAIAAGIEVIAITDHADFAAGDSIFSPPAYLEHLQQVGHDCRDSLVLLRGVELGIQYEHAPACAAFLAGQAFDFVIGSMHRAMEQDFFNGEFFAGRSADDCWQTYLNETIRAVKSCSNFDVLGHLDIIRRYHTTRNSQLPESCSDQLEELMQWLVSNGRGIEINTSGIRYGLDSFHPLPDILARYRKAGGSIITIGSDSHNLQSLGRDFAAATDLLRSLGFRYHCWYKNREPQFAEL